MFKKLIFIFNKIRHVDFTNASFRFRVKNIFLDRVERWAFSSSKKPIFLRIVLLYGLIFFEKKEKKLGALWSKSDLVSVLAAAIGNRFNLNNLGNMYTISDVDLSLSQKIEKEVIEWNKEIIDCKDADVEGYISSGGTESNLFLMWMGREFLKKKSKKKPNLLLTNFTHYSISKAGRILDLQFKVIKTDSQSWGMSLLDLEKTLLSSIEQGEYSFLLPITIGYSSTGASDPMKDIVDLIEKMQSKYSKLHCFLWVDAAAQGLPMSFLNNDFTPLKHHLISGYIVDFHKYGGVPLPSGIVLYRNYLREFIETPIPYLFESDATISGSRPGSSALSIWLAIYKNNNSWKRKFFRLEKRKKYLTTAFKKRNHQANIISFANSLTFAVEINSDFEELPREVEEEHALIKCNINGFIHYKFHIQ